MRSKPLYCTFIHFNNKQPLKLGTKSLEMNNHIFSIINYYFIEPENEINANPFIVFPNPDTSRNKGLEKHIIVNKRNVNYIEFLEDII